MAWFRRKQNQQTTIPELQEYYNAEKRERSSLAWLLALVSVAVTALVLIGLVFGGKWLYNKLANDMDSQPQTTSTPTENQPENQATGEAETAPTTPTGSSESASTSTPPASTGSTPAASTPSTPPASSESTGSSSSPTSGSSSSTASNNSGLPHTGPEGMVSVVLGTVAVATFWRYFALKRRA